MSPTAKQQVLRARRSYNRWVNNQTLEDYALRFTANASRRWSLSRVANTALGAISFLALEAIGAAITINYGFTNAISAIIVVSVLIFLAGLPICYYAAKYGVDIDLLTRGAGFGYIGSTATSLIYASFTFIFFALEAAIMARAFELLFGLPLALGYILSSVVVIPLVFHGITFISRFQVWTQPIWIVLQVLPFIFIFLTDSQVFNEWRQYEGARQADNQFDIFLFGAAASVMFALVAQIGEQVDFLRFLPDKKTAKPHQWWFALIIGGPGWVIIGALKILAGSLLAVVAINAGIALSDASDPTMMYSVAFSYITDNGQFALALAGVFVVVSQLKINVTNAYAGSIAWSNFFSRLTHNHPGRVVWLVFNVAISLLLMELGIYHAFEHTLSIYAIVAVGWVGSLVADLVINKHFGLSPSRIEFKRAHLYDINPVGVGSMLLASALGIMSYLGFFGPYAKALAHFVTLISSMVLAPAIAWLTKGKFYIARESVLASSEHGVLACCVCENRYEIDDIAQCPAYAGPICSLCCSLDSRCQDSCKDGADITQNLAEILRHSVPRSWKHYINNRIVHFGALLFLIAALIGILLALIYSTAVVASPDAGELLALTLWKVFFILLIIGGVIAWLFVLAHESRVVAQNESQTQTQRLIKEIEAHEETDRKLQEAKETAEAANNAKSRYLTGISHELRTPLNTVLGYAQLLEMDPRLHAALREQVSVIKRSSGHLADLIEGLLDISKIEAGRLDLHRNHIQINALMNQLVHMFRLQARDRGLQFRYERRTPLPELVLGDEQRLRQILINLLSNAIKFTEHGEVRLSISYRNQVAEIKVADTGVGIPEEEMERIFKPFERVRRPGAPSASGTGLGLTITRLLADIMGGDIAVKNNPDGGVTFTVWLMLSHVVGGVQKPPKPRHISGYHGPSKSVMVVDDDATHRGLVGDLLTPLKFHVVEATDAQMCLAMLDNFQPDIFLIDYYMPGINGLELCAQLRAQQYTQPMLIVSANAHEDSTEETQNTHYDDYIVKPIKLDQLLERLAAHLQLNWMYVDELAQNPLPQKTHFERNELPEIELCKKIVQAAEIGHLSRLKEIANELEQDTQTNAEFLAWFISNVKTLNFNRLIDLVKVKNDVQN